MWKTWYQPAARAKARAAAPPAVSERAARRVRRVILAYDVLRVLAGGVAVKFVGVYFVQEHHLSPSMFLALTLAAQAAMFAFTYAAGRLCAAGSARERVCFALLLLTDAGNFGLALAHGARWQAAGWVLREGANNGIFGLKQTLLMDHTPKRDRGKWNSLDGLQSSFWSGSAMLGGWLIERYDYRVNFQAMSWGFVGATLVWGALLRRAPEPGAG